MSKKISVEYFAGPEPLFKDENQPMKWHGHDLALRGLSKQQERGDRGRGFHDMSRESPASCLL